VKKVDPPAEWTEEWQRDKTEADRQKIFALESGSGLELRLVHDSDEPQRAVELWTARTLYWLDSNRACISVLDRESGRTEKDHPFLGARLAGGEDRDGSGALSLADPYPLPGMKAVFLVQLGEKHRYGHTSAVERVIVRVRVTNVDTEAQKEPTWDAITAQTRKKTMIGR
jgi:hypothetical protein